MESTYKHIAVKSVAGDLLEIEISARLYLAFLANTLGFPFIYTPIKSTLCVAKSEFGPDVLNCKWEDFFRQVADEFIHIDSLHEEVFLQESYFFASKKWLEFKVDYSSGQELTLDGDTRKILEKIYGVSLKRNKLGPVSLVRQFIKKSHCAYVNTFAPDTRVSFENDTLQAAFVIHEDGGLRTPLFFERLITLLDFVERCAQSVDCDLRLDLLTSFELDQAVPDCWTTHKAQVIEEACSRPYVHLRQSLSFEEILKTVAGADLSWMSDTFFGRDILRGTLMLVSRPEQILIDMLPNNNDFRLNNCFLMWDEEKVLYEKKKLSKMLNVVRHGTRRQNTLFKRCKKRVLSAHKQSGKSTFSVTSGVIDGIGSTFLKIFLMQLIADYYNLQYVHSRQMSIDHNYKAAPDWFRKWERFFMLGEGRPKPGEVFGDKSSDVHYFYNLPALSDLRNLDLPSDALVVANMVSLYRWPVPDDYLSQKILQVRTAFHERHRHREDGFSSGVVNVAAHIRAIDNYLPPVREMFRRVSRAGAQCDLSAYVHRIKVFYNTMQQLGMPFNLHIYSDVSRRDLEPLLEFGDIHLHLSEEDSDWRLSCLEMSRADVLLLSYSRISYVAALLAKPNQLKLATISPEVDLSRLLIHSGNAYYRENVGILKDAQLMEKFLNRHF